MNTGYLIYQAERPRTATELRDIDTVHGELTASLVRRLRALAAATRFPRRGHTVPYEPRCLADLNRAH